MQEPTRSSRPRIVEVARRSIGSLAISSAIAAQATWIVDIDGRPGAHFNDLPAAVAAAATGDRILVRESAFLLSYRSFTTSKGLTIVGVQSSPAFIGTMLSTAIAPVRIQALPAGVTFTLSARRRHRSTSRTASS